MTHPRYILAGSIGRGNWGDEAMLLAALGRYPKDRCFVISADPPLTRATHGCACVGQREWLTIWRALRPGASLIFIGGSLLQSVTSVRSLFYFVGLLAMARWAGAEIILEGQGWGPFHSPWAEGLAIVALRWAQRVELRDPVAFERLKSLGSQVTLGLDPAFRLRLRVSPYKTLKGSVALILRPHAMLTRPRQKILREFCLSLLDRWKKKLVFLPLAAPDDVALAQTFVANLQGEGRVIEMVVPGNLTQALQVLATMELVFSMRYHGCVFAELLQRKYIGLAYDPKIAHHCRLYRRPCLNIHTLSLDQLNYLWSEIQLEVRDPVL